ncbi:hypothetical protein U3516DRAFT_617679, partial [Neocallimastix sp. 'constans']
PIFCIVYSFILYSRFLTSKRILYKKEFSIRILCKNYEIIEKNLVTPKNNIVVTNEKYSFKHPISVLVKDKVLLYNSDFDIKDINGITYFKCKLKSFGKVHICDTFGNLIYNFSLKNLTFLKTINFFEGKLEYNNIGHITPEQSIIEEEFDGEFFNKVTSKKEEFKLKCDVVRKSAVILYKKDAICKINRNVKGYYTVDIAEGVDVAFIIGLVISYDKLN